MELRIELHMLRRLPPEFRSWRRMVRHIQLERDLEETQGAPGGIVYPVWLGVPLGSLRNSWRLWKTISLGTFLNLLPNKDKMEWMDVFQFHLLLVLLQYLLYKGDRQGKNKAAPPSRV